jgi:hypothetical protein
MQCSRTGRLRTVLYVKRRANGGRRERRLVLSFIHVDRSEGEDLAGAKGGALQKYERWK